MAQRIRSNCCDRGAELPHGRLAGLENSWTESIRSRSEDGRQDREESSIFYELNRLGDDEEFRIYHKPDLCREIQEARVRSVKMAVKLKMRSGKGEVFGTHVALMGHVVSTASTVLQA